MQVKTMRQGIPISVIMQIHGQVIGRSMKFQNPPIKTEMKLEIITNTQGSAPTINTNSSVQKHSNITAHTGKIHSIIGQHNKDIARNIAIAIEVINIPGHETQRPIIKKLKIA